MRAPGATRAGELPHLGILRLPEGSPVPALLRRIGLGLALIVLTAVLLWFDRDGLRDNAHPGRVLSFVDVFYFTVVSLATVGYGDIAPVSDQARLINALVFTPLRIFIWVLFLGTAYEVTLFRFQLREDYRMRQLRERLDGHVIVCGYGVKGRAIVDELLAHGHERESIVVIDPDEDSVAAAAKAGLVGLRGDASSEELLRAAVIDKASYVLAAPNRDDACVLICLTVKNLAPEVHLVASAREEENIKLLYHAGADMVVAPSVSGGRLMAAAVHQEPVARFLEDLLSFANGLGAAEHIVRPEEAGLLASQLPELRGTLVIGVSRGKERCPFSELDTFPLQTGDAVVYIANDAHPRSHG